MLVSRKVPDALAAASCGAAVILIAVGVKEIPNAISYLGIFSSLWGILTLLGSLGAGVGAMLRNRANEGEPGWKRKLWSIRLERACWPLIGLTCSVFVIGVVARVGLVDGLTSIGYGLFVIFTCVGNWQSLKWAARREGPSP